MKVLILTCMTDFIGKGYVDKWYAGREQKRGSRFDYSACISFSDDADHCVVNEKTIDQSLGP